MAHRVKQMGLFLAKEFKTFFSWFKWAFADTDAPGRPPGTPSIRNLVIGGLTIVFCVAFLKVVYLMEVVVHHEVRASTSTADMNFKSVAPGQDNPVLPNYGTATPTPAPVAPAQDNDQVTYNFQIPDMPGNWLTFFEVMLGVVIGGSAVKKVAEYKYGAGPRSFETQQTSTSTTDVAAGTHSTVDQASGSSTGSATPGVTP